MAVEFIDLWQNRATGVTPEAVALALRAAICAEKAHREAQTVELVWTGPGTEAHPFRRTEQAVLQVLDSARQRIILVSYAVYRIPNIREALVRAARRGVRINVIVETPEKLEGENEYSTLRALGDDVAACSAVYYWPKEKRGHDDKGKLGILHVKCAVADGRWLFRKRPVKHVLAVVVWSVHSPRRMHRCLIAVPIPPASGSGGSDWPGGRSAA
jgi:phosphatidylserine/phosphatidylglycerophosphate/cardiolipin synthase-like enzyme